MLFGFVRLPAIIPRLLTFPRATTHLSQENYVIELLRWTWQDNDGQDIAEYAVMLAVILVIVVGVIRFIGSAANNTFSGVASNIGQV